MIKWFTKKKHIYAAGKAKVKFTAFRNLERWRWSGKKNVSPTPTTVLPKGMSDRFYFQGHAVNKKSKIVYVLEIGKQIPILFLGELTAFIDCIPVSLKYDTPLFFLNANISTYITQFLLNHFQFMTLSVTQWLNLGCSLWKAQINKAPRTWGFFYNTKPYIAIKFPDFFGYNLRMHYYQHDIKQTFQMFHNMISWYSIIWSGKWQNWITKFKWYLEYWFLGH